MKTVIDTKFNVGDMVYVADHYYDFYANRIPYLIKAILIDVNHRRTRIAYEVEQGDATYRIPEAWVFATYEECAEWCEKENESV